MILHHTLDLNHTWLWINKGQDFISIYQKQLKMAFSAFFSLNKRLNKKRLEERFKKKKIWSGDNIWNPHFPNKMV